MKRSPVLLVCLIALVDMMGFGLIIPLTADYAKRFDASAAVLGGLVGIYALLGFVFMPILGRWSDRIGRRPVLMVSMIGSMASHLLLGVADLRVSLTLLFVARALDGLTGANIATAQAYIADVTEARERAKGMGLFGATLGMGFVLGPLFGSLLAKIGEWATGPQFATAWPAFGAAALSGVSAALVHAFLPESLHGQVPAASQVRVFSVRRFLEAVRRPRIRELLVVTFWSTFAFVFLEATFVYLIKERFGFSFGKVAMMFAYLGIIRIVVQGTVVGEAAKRIGEPGMIALGPFLNAIGFLALSSLPSLHNDRLAFWVLMFSGLPIGLGTGILNPGISSLISRHAEQAEHGKILGLSQGMASLSRCLAPVIGGYLYDRAPDLPYWVGAAILALCGAFAVKIRPAHQDAIAVAERTRAEA